ncbi:hypothetical protein [Salinimonas chungwhensis]|uniref:hypothetical protein n=1 Tax=Salinimonas chungwhensis TaxID=265425 RepID=UPI00037AF338|nr:hypothetical protein [Salinimonas chungwhensis]
MKYFILSIVIVCLSACSPSTSNQEVDSNQELLSAESNFAGKKLEAIKATIANLESRGVDIGKLYVEVEELEDSVVVVLIDKAYSDTVHVGGGGETQECIYDLVKKEIKHCLHYQ